MRCHVGSGLSAVLILGWASLASTSTAGAQAAPAQAAPAQAPQPAGVLFENVRIFNGTAGRLSGPSNVLVVGNVIRTISAAPIPSPAGMAMTRVAGGGRTLM